MQSFHKRILTFLKYLLDVMTWKDNLYVLKGFHVCHSSGTGGGGKVISFLSIVPKMCIREWREAPCMDANVSKFQVVLRFMLQILLADSHKRFKTQLMTNSWYTVELQGFYFPLLLLNFKNPLVRTKLTTCNSTSPTAYKECRGRNHYRKR